MSQVRTLKRVYERGVIVGRGLSNLVNAVDTELAASVAPSDLTITVTDASELPVAPFYLVIDPFGDTTREYLYCTSVAGPVLTVLRDIQGSQSTTHASGDLVRIAVTEQNVQDLWERTLTTLLDVDLTNPQIFDGLVFDPVTSLWENVPNLSNFGIVTLPYQMESPYLSTPTPGFISPNNALAANVSLITVNEVGLAPPPFNEYGFVWNGIDGGDTILIRSVLDPDAWAEWDITTATLRSGQYYDLTIGGLINQGSTYPPLDDAELLVFVFHTDSKHTVSTVAPANPQLNDVWVDPSADDAAQSLPITGGTLTGGQSLGSSLVRNMFVGPTAPGSPALGDVWLDNS